MIFNIFRHLCWQFPVMRGSQLKEALGIRGAPETASSSNPLQLFVHSTFGTCGLWHILLSI